MDKKALLILGILYSGSSMIKNDFLYLYPVIKDDLRIGAILIYGTILNENFDLLSNSNDLIDKLNCKYILVTYNNSFTTSQSSRNKISYEQMTDILSSKGNLEVFENDYKAFNAGKTNIEGHKELIFFVEVK